MRRSARIHRPSPPLPPRAPTPDLDEKYPDDEEKHSQIDEPAPAPLETLAIVCANPPPPRPRKKRGKYKPRLTTEQRTEIVHMWVNEGRSKPNIIDAFQKRGIMIPPSTIDTIIARHRKTNRIAITQPRSRSLKYKHEERERIANIQKEHNDWTYDQVAAQWRREWSHHNGGRECPKRPSHATLANIFKEFDVTTKTLTAIPAARNSIQLIDQRAAYCCDAMTWDRESLIFLDETGFDKHLHRRRGRSGRGKLAVYTEPTSAGNRLNVCAAVSPVHGLIQYRVLLTSWNEIEFSSFIQGLIAQPALRNKSHYIVMDSVAWHHSQPVHDVLLGSRVAHEIKKLPAYSPHLNAIEYVFSVWKAAIKRTNQVTATETLEQQVEKASKLVTDRLVTRCLDHVYQYYAHCMMMKPLEDFDPLMDLAGHGEHMEDVEDEKKE